MTYGGIKMSQIICPECNKKISSYAKQCPDCGFPMDDFLKEHGLNDFDKAWICTKCGEIYNIDTLKRPICEYCNNILVQTDITNDEACMNLYSMNEDEYDNYEKELACKYGSNYSEAAFKIRRKKIHKDVAEYEKQIDNHQPSKQQSTPHCPTCNSTNIKRISAASKAVGVGLFGIFSKTARSQFECKDCGYKW